MQEKIDYKKINLNIAKEYFENKNVVFTGKGFLVRGELGRLARQAGANVESLVSKRTHILIVGEKPGSKLRKAKMLGCKIISTADFQKILYGIKIEEIYNVETSCELLNINCNLENNNLKKNHIINKRIVVLVDNEMLMKKINRIISENGGIILDELNLSNVDLIVYQLNSKNNKIIEEAKMKNIEIITVGKFNKLLME